MRAKLIEDGMGGASAPMTTLNNTPGIGNATPAAAADGNAIGSGDKWDNDTTDKKKKKKKPVGPFEKPATQAVKEEKELPINEMNESFRSKQYRGMRGWVDKWLDERRGMYAYSTSKGPNFHTHTRRNGQKISGFLEKFYPYDYYDKPDEINPYNNKPNSEPVELFLIPLFKKGHFKVVDLEKGIVLNNNMRIEYETDDEDLGFMIGGWSGPTVFESNISPYDKIGQMMAKQMGVKTVFKAKGDPANNEVEQEHWKEAEEPSHKAPDQKTQQLSKGKIHEIGMEENGRFILQTLDSYVKASKHVPDHPLTTHKKGTELNEEELRDVNATKDVKGKEAMEDLGIAYEFKPGPSGKDRCFIKEPMNDVLTKLKQGGWEKSGKNPENTLWLFTKEEKEMRIWADGKDLPRVTVTPKKEKEEETSESVKPVIKKLVSSSFNPYLKK